MKYKDSTILIVDDTILNLDILVELLSDYKVMECTNGFDALEIIDKQKVDLILLDIMMPEIDGYEVCRRLKSNPKTKDIPVVFITARIDEESIVKAYEVGGIDYITKPFMQVEVLSKVKIQLNLQSMIIDLEKSQEELKSINDSLETRVADEVDKNKKNQIIMMQQSRHAQMGEMISMIAHQWRQPLNSLSILNQLIVVKCEKNELDDQFLKIFDDSSKKQIQQMSSTIEDFSNFFKPEKEVVEFSLNNVIDQTLGILKPILSKNFITLDSEIEDDFYIKGYPNELSHALLNILSNSKDALIDKNIENKKIKFSVQRINNEVMISISDNAKGIPDNIKDKIFDPYFSTKNKKNGTGLGLYMTKIIIEDHMHGKLCVINDKDGALFTVKLPIKLKG